MWVYMTAGYLLVGLASAGFTLAVFPPQTGYRPPLRWIVTAILSYIVLWPFLGMIGIGYVVGRLYNRPDEPRTAVVRAGQRRRQLYRSLYEETPN